MKLISTVPTPAAIYYNENIVCNQNFNGDNTYKRSIVNDTLLEHYVPVFNAIKIEVEKNTRLVNSNNYNDSYSVEAVITKKNDNTSRTIDVTQGDLLGNSVDFVLNFSDHNVVVKNYNNFTKAFPKINNKKLLEKYGGKILIISLYSLNRESILNEIYGKDNPYNNPYIKAGEEVKAVYEFIKQNAHKLIDTYNISSFAQPNNEKDKISTIKVCTLLVIDADEFKVIKGDGTIVETLFLKSKNLIVSIKPIDQVEEHPYSSFLLTLNEKNYESLKGKTAICYIIDNNDRIGERYFNFASSVFEINKFKDNTKKDGLYVEYDNQSKFFPLEELLEDKVDFIYKNREEAKKGADVVTQSKRDHELTVLKLNKQLAELKARYEADIKQMEIEHKEKLAKVEEEARKNKLSDEKDKGEYERLLRELEIARAKHKYDIEASSLILRREYEERKYKQDFTLESVKTVGLLATAGLSLFLLYNKFKNN